MLSGHIFLTLYIIECKYQSWKRQLEDRDLSKKKKTQGPRENYLKLKNRIDIRCLCKKKTFLFILGFFIFACKIKEGSLCVRINVNLNVCWGD